MLNNKSKLVKERRNNTITTKNICVRFFIILFLRNEKAIINKQKYQN